MVEASDHTAHWDEKFRTRRWGRYPPEDFVRFMGRNFKHSDRSAIRVLEVGCGPGANTWFLHREGFAVSAIDVSPTAIELAEVRLVSENAGLNKIPFDLRVGNFEKLPWSDDHFDVVADIFAIYSNRMDLIRSVLSEVARVLRPCGLFYCKLWGRETTGYGTGVRIEDGTYDQILTGPCRDMGVSHFFDRTEIESVFGKIFTPLAIDRVLRSDTAANQQIEEFHCQFRRN